MPKHNSETLSALPELKPAKAAHKSLIAKLNEAHGMKATIDRCEARFKELKDEIQQIQQQLDLPQFRAGRFCCITTQTAGRRTLDKAMLVDNGVDPDIIEASYKEGAPSQRTEFPVIETE